MLFRELVDINFLHVLPDFIECWMGFSHAVKLLELTWASFNTHDTLGHSIVV